MWTGPNDAPVSTKGERMEQLYNYTFTSIEPPKLSSWRCELFGTGPNGVVFRPVEGKEPNWFWRLMQWLCFGNKWIKDAKPVQE